MKEANITNWLQALLMIKSAFVAGERISFTKVAKTCSIGASLKPALERLGYINVTGTFPGNNGGCEGEWLLDEPVSESHAELAAAMSSTVVMEYVQDKNRRKGIDPQKPANDIKADIAQLLEEIRLLRIDMTSLLDAVTKPCDAS